MKVFLTGATGFIGQHLCEALAREGHQIIALVRSPEKAKRLHQENVELLMGNLSDLKKNDFAIPACDLVIHLAGLVAAKRSVQYYRTNFDATANLVRCLERQSWRPKRLIFCSSLAAAGPSWGHHALSEKDESHPVDDYGRSKRMAEDFLLGQKTFPVTIVRPPIVIGPHDDNVLNLFKIAKKGLGILPRGNDQLLSFISVDDLVTAFVLILNDTSTDHRTYFVTYDQPTSAHEIWQEVARTLDKKISIIHIPKPFLYLVMKTNMFLGRFGRACTFDKKYYDQLYAEAWVCSAESLKKDFAWQAKESLSEVVNRTAKSYKEQGLI
jgi:nucleoside-diphosphate-sugar epimerase